MSAELYFAASDENRAAGVEDATVVRAIATTVVKSQGMFHMAFD